MACLYWWGFAPGNAIPALRSTPQDWLDSGVPDSGGMRQLNNMCAQKLGSSNAINQSGSVGGSFDDLVPRRKCSVFSGMDWGRCCLTCKEFECGFSHAQCKCLQGCHIYNPWNVRCMDRSAAKPPDDHCLDAVFYYNSETRKCTGTVTCTKGALLTETGDLVWERSPSFKGC